MKLLGRISAALPVVMFSAALVCACSDDGGSNAGAAPDSGGKEEEVPQPSDETKVAVTIGSKTVYVGYALNGGTSNAADFKICSSDGTLTTNLSREGYTFGGWYTDSAFKGTAITKITGNTTVYAKWTANTYTVKFDPNGASGSMASQTFTYGKAQQLNAVTFTHAGHSFAGWATSAKGGVSYKDGQSVSNLASQNGATLTLYAVWISAGSYAITYELDGGENGANPASYLKTDLPVTLAAATKTGCNFAGWFSDKEFTRQVTEIASGTEGNLTLYAKWTAQTIVLTLNLDNEGQSMTLSGDYGSPVTAPAAPSKEGCLFSGWNPPLPETFVQDGTYAAVWKEGIVIRPGDNITKKLKVLEGKSGTHTVFVTGSISSEYTLKNLRTAINALNASELRICLDLSESTIASVAFSYYDGNYTGNKSEGCEKLESVILPKGINSIGEGAFYKCPNLKEIVIPESVTEIGEYAFYGCSSLEGVVIPESVPKIGRSAFSGCSSLKEIVIPEGMTEIVVGLFSGCSSLESVVIPESVTEIGEYAFGDCSSLESIVIPESVTEIGYSAFYGCKSLESVVIPEDVTEIKYNLFYGCSSLKNVVIPEGVTKIGYYAFYFCSSLENIIIPESVSIIESDAFAGCRSLKEIVIPEGASLDGTGGEHFAWCSKLESIVIPEGTTTLYRTFSYCTNLKDVKLPKSLTRIAAYTFQGCTSLENLVIPENVEKIERDIFYGCTNLKGVTFLPKNPPELASVPSMNFYYNIADDANKTFKVYVPSANFSAYRGGAIKAGWGDLYNQGRLLQLTSSN